MSLVRTTVEPGVERLQLGSWRGEWAGYDVSAYLIDGILVDSGFPRAAHSMLRLVHQIRPRGAVITHWHEDHAGNVPALASMGLPLAMQPQCETTLRERPHIRLYRDVVWGRTSRLVGPVTSFSPAPLEIIATPGHTEDHQVLWDAHRRIVVSGDLFLGVKVRVAHIHESPRALLASLRAIAALEPRLLLDAHRGVIRDAAAQLRAKIEWTEGQIAQIEELGAEGVSARAIVRRLYGAESFVGWVSAGEYSRRSFVRAVLREAAR
ncbi:MAG: Zn-dependent hydrolase, glyoxylase [Gemmatimonadetes bacterium]|nr:Zn-dependent hydrolase, glyoxylase [Gemmatimonadota bacterium]